MPTAGKIHSNSAEVSTGGAVDLQRRRILKALALAPLLSSSIFGSLSGCGSGSETGDAPAASPETRTWEMGFFCTPPRLDAAAMLQTIDLFTSRAELAVLHEELPWTDLLGGMSPDAILERDKVGLVNYLRGKGLRLFFMADLTDGLARDQEAPQLRRLGRSITEPVVQQYYRDYVRTVALKLQPDYIGLAAETNLIRTVAPPAVYDGVVQAANDAAADLQTAAVTAPLLISVQVETAWGVLAGPGAYTGVEQDFSDFPFTQILGLSSYPYFSFARPEDIPDDYYSRLLNGRALPSMVCEGGWSSASLGTFISSPELQARYITRHAGLLDSIEAEAVAQTLFADIDLDGWPQPIPANLPLFTAIGLTDDNFSPKAALAAWDALFARSKV